MQAIAACQAKGGTAAFVDAEHALDPVYAEKLGVNVDQLLVSQPDTGEQALEITDMLVRSGAVDLVVVSQGYRMCIFNVQNNCISYGFLLPLAAVNFETFFLNF